MKKVVTILVLLLLLNFCVTAHPGRTDSNGGHRNRSTGEYHYHHGYPEHQHYDIDGDGKRDCPYIIEREEKKKEQEKRDKVFYWIFGSVGVLSLVGVPTFALCVAKIKNKES